jgi:LacI family transcriptional regulator, galactose operon repressor
MDKKVTIYDIAEAVGVSVGTVHRAVNDRPGINEMTRARVLQMAEKMGYRPNLAARYLSKKRDLVISVNTPKDPESFYGPVRAGIEDESTPFRMANVQIQHRTFPRLGIGEEEAFEAAIEAKVDGVIVVPGSPRNLKTPIRRASRAHIPVVCLINDGPGTEKLTTVSVDTVASGAMVAELMGRLLQGKGQIAITSGDLEVADHIEKYDAFTGTLKSLFPAMEIFPPIENHESEAEAYEKTLAFLSAHPDISGIYVSTGNGAPVLRAVETAGLFGKLVIFTTNLYPALVPRLESGQVVGTVYERPYSQGRIAFRTVLDYLVENKMPTVRMMLDPVLVMKSNLQRVIRRVGWGMGESSANSAANPGETMVDYIAAADR